MNILNPILKFIPLLLISFFLSSAAHASESYEEVPVDDSWAFEPKPDPFTDEALLDLRDLNEAYAGEHGFIKLSDDGMSFVRGDGEAIRFWSIIMTLDSRSIRGMTDEEARRTYRFYAKRGVNMVRLFTGFHVAEKGADIMDVDEDSIKVLHRHLAAAREAGIYVTISPYWGHFNVPESWELEGVAGTPPKGLLLFNPRLQAAYKNWLREAYTRINPYTGLAIIEDPAVAILQVHNEDSLFFWTAQRIPEAQMRILSRHYADWLTERYGSLQAAVDSWDGYTIEGDNVESGVLRMVGGQAWTWELTQHHQGGKAKRIRTQLAFLTHLQRDFYQDMDHYFRDVLGSQSLTNASNWRTASADHLGDLERWTYTACDVAAINDYSGGIHDGPQSGWRINPGDRIVNRSMIRVPLNLPTNRKQVQGMPMIVTESKWVFPNLYQTEGAFLGAAYMSVTGVDSLYFTHMNGPEWLQEFRRMFNKMGDQYALGKWWGNTPQEVGSFPANALLFRKGHLRQADPAVVEHRTMEDLLDRNAPAITESATYDPNRDQVDTRSWDASADGPVSRLAYLVGPVVADYGAEKDDLRLTELPKYIDTDSQIVRSMTGEVVTDYGKGISTMNSPKAQGVAGFLRSAGGTFKLSDVVFESSNDYATLQVVSMDDRAIADSGQLLIQAGTVVRPSGWTVRDVSFEHKKEMIDGQEIVTTGAPPYRIANTHAKLTVRNPGLRKATVLDAGGYPVGDLEIQKNIDSVSLKLPPDAMYVILSK